MSAPAWLFIQYLLNTLDGLTTGMMMECSLKASRQDLGIRVFRICCYWFMVALICLPSYLMHYKILPALNLVFTVLGTVGLTIVLYGTSLRQSIILFGFYLMLICLCELIMMVFYPDVFTTQFDWTSDINPEPLFAGVLFLLPLKCGFGLVYRYKGLEKAERNIFHLLFTINLILMSLLLVPLYMLISSSEPDPVRTIQSLINYASFFTMLLLLSALLFYLQQKHDAGRASHLSVYSDLQNQYYSSMKRNSQMQAKLLHDYKNVLLSARSLLLQHQEEEARNLLLSFRSRLQEVRSPENGCFANLSKASSLSEKPLLSEEN